MSGVVNTVWLVYRKSIDPGLNGGRIVGRSIAFHSYVTSVYIGFSLNYPGARTAIGGRIPGVALSGDTRWRRIYRLTLDRRVLGEHPSLERKDEAQHNFSFLHCANPRVLEADLE